MTLQGRRADPSPKKVRLLGPLIDFIARGGRLMVGAFVAFLANSFGRLRPHLRP